MSESDTVSRIMFLSDPNATLGVMAMGFAKNHRHERMELIAGGMEAPAVTGMAAKVMAEIGIDIGVIRPIHSATVSPPDLDVVIALCGKAQTFCLPLPGYPLCVNWNLQDPAIVRGDAETILTAHRRARDELRRLVDDFFERGYASALAASRQTSNLVLSNISDGILAHDLKRRIFYFNRAAERITGYTSREVVNRDCHDVFPGNFCGGKCDFADGAPAPDFETAQKRIELTTKSGERRSVDMRLCCLRGPEGNAPVGVVASFRDFTQEHEMARRLGKIQQFSGIIGSDPKMLELFDLIRELAATNAPVMIQGESGTGKELVAAAIHNEGPRAGKLFVPVNCGALPESLLESELFGHVRGAFTGAIRDKKGRFELADGGTIFLDEIGDISPAMQVKLLRVLQEGRFERVGSEKTVQVDVRVISATNKNIHKEIAAGRFREDLFYRLSVVPLTIPPLRERRTDIPILVTHVLRSILEEQGKPPIEVSAEAMDLIISHDWPGNVRELQNWLQFALVKCKGQTIQPQHLPIRSSLLALAAPGPAATADAESPRRRKMDMASVEDALKKTGGNKLEAAKLLGVSRATLYRFLDENGELQAPGE
jgi:sigma-54 dependent transcriptional regulator, acetoin dehydrogenase operon transcriptional activator AcoR